MRAKPPAKSPAVWSRARNGEGRRLDILGRSGQMPRSTSRGRGRSPAGRNKNASRGQVPGGAAAPTSTSDRQSFLVWCLFCGVLVAATVSLSVSLPLTPVSRVELERMWLCCLGLSLPHLWYTWLWRSPQKWVARCKRVQQDPSLAMMKFAAMLKVVQFSAFVLWLCSFATQMDVLRGVHARLLAQDTTMLIAVALLIVGQALNTGAMKAISVDGIYYGVRFGKKIPWCTSWPYGGLFSVPHPQYVGSVLTVWALVLGACLPVHYHSGALCLGAVWTIFYVFTGVMEHYF